MEQQYLIISVSVSKFNGLIIPSRIEVTFVISSCTGTHDVQNTVCNIKNEPVTVTIDYIENTEALGALLALMYLNQDDNIVCDQSLYAAIRRSEDNFTLPMGDPAMTNSYMELVYCIIRRNEFDDKAYPAVSKPVDMGKVANIVSN